MGFDDLDDAIADQDADEESATDSQSTDETSMTETTTETDTTTTTLDQPAFSFDEAKQEAIYPRKETLTEFEDSLDFEVKRALRDEGIRDVPKREYHDALLRLAIENPDRLADLVKDARQ